jgi:RNA polymerase sigma-70 factor, ECF subfamily
MVLRRCRRLLKDEEQAVDAMQDTFVELLRHEAQLTDLAPSSLLFRIATNVCLNRIRTRRRHPEDAYGELLYRIADSEEAEQTFFAKNLFHRLFRGEKESTKTIAVLHLVDGMTLEEVATAVGLSVSGVRKRLRPLRDKLGDLQGVEL